MITSNKAKSDIAMNNSNIGHNNFKESHMIWTIRLAVIAITVKYSPDLFDAIGRLIVTINNL